MFQFKDIVYGRPPKDTPSGWAPHKILTAIGRPPPPGKMLRFPAAVIGGGFTGLAAARRLAELWPHREIVLIDAMPIGWGASGRNSGFIIDLPHKFDLDSRDADRLKSIVELNRGAIALLKHAVLEHQVECEWSEVGKLQGAVRTRGTGKMARFKDALDVIGEPYEALDRDDVEEVTGTRYYSGAVHTPGCVLMNPVGLTRGLARSLPTNVTIFDSAPVISFERAGNGHLLEIFHAGVSTSLCVDNILFCANAYAPQFGYLRQRIIPIITFASMTRPLTDHEMANFTGRADWGLTPADPGGTTLRMTRDRRILVRNQYDYCDQFGVRDEHLPKIRLKHRQSFDKRYPALAHVPFASTWGGICGLSSNHASFFGKLDRNVWGSVCHNGVGVARGTISGHLIAEAACGEESEQLSKMYAVSNLLTANPPDPILGVGVRARLRYEAWKSRTEI